MMFTLVAVVSGVILSKLVVMGAGRLLSRYIKNGLRNDPNFWQTSPTSAVEDLDAIALHVRATDIY
jgi:hypothetical protein